MKKFLINLKLVVKILLCVMIPLSMTMIVGVLGIVNTSSILGCKLEEDHLDTAGYAIEKMLDQIGSDTYTLQGDNLYKGSVNLTKDNTFMDEFKKRSNIDTTIFYGNVRRSSNIEDESGMSVIGTTMDPDVYAKVKRDGYAFSKDLLIGGVPYYGCYNMISNDGDGLEVIIFTGIESSTVRNIYTAKTIQAIIVMLVIAAIFAFIAYRVTISITTNMKESITGLSKVANCDLSFTMKPKLLSRRDEVGKIAGAIVSMVSTLLGVIHNIKDSTVELKSFTGKFQTTFDTIQNSISDIDTVIEGIADGASQNAMETQSVSNQMEEVSNAVNTVTEHVNSLKDYTNQMKQQNDNVHHTLEELITISNHTKESICTVHEQTTSTNESANEIQKVIDIINDIAEQTNFLSLNASIEASRAGEHGKGFAVVATEVRHLAEQSKESANKIVDIIKELSDKSDKSVTMMSSLMSEINNQYEKLDQTKKLFDTLNDEIDSVSNAIEIIADQIITINKSKDSVYSNLENLAAISQENAASTQETSSSITELSDMISECRKSLSTLKTITKTLTDDVNTFKVNNK